MAWNRSPDVKGPPRERTRTNGGACTAVSDEMPLAISNFPSIIPRVGA